MTTFADLGVPDHLVRALGAQGISEPTAVQAASLPGALAGRDVAAQAPTGSGKTLAFGLPVLIRGGHGTPRRPASLVLVPTRELATQVTDALTPLAGRDGLRLLAVFGGVGIRPQIRALRQGVDVVVGCPGRIEDLIDQGALDLRDVTLAVVDEADRMADVGFLPAVRRLLAATASERQTLLFSATLGGPVGALVRDHQRSPERHDVAAPVGQPSRARHLAAAVADDQRTRHTAEIARAAGSTIVFTRTRHRADRVARQLDRLGLSTAAIHGGRSQAQRTRALDGLHAGRVQVLVATDVAARGIHVDDLACVVHYDAPEDTETYVHRSGRTGRAGADGVVVSLVGGGDLGRDGRLRRSPAPKDVAVTVVTADELAAEVGAAAPARPARTDGPGERAAAPRTQKDGRNDRGTRHAAPRDRSRPGRERPTGSTQAGDRPTRGRPARTHDEPRRRESAPARRRSPAGAGGVVDGKVKFFHAGRGFGFIEVEGRPDVFLHHTKLANRAPRTVRDGDRVRFRLDEGPRGLQALDVEVV